MKTQKLTKVISIVLVISGLLITAKPAYNLLRWQIVQLGADSIWKNSVEVHGHPVMKQFIWLDVPSADVKTIVRAGGGQHDLLRYPCVQNDDQKFHDEGINVILAHRNMHFSRLGKVKTGDDILVELLDGTKKEYKVLETEIVPKDLATRRVNEKNKEDWLVLATCYPFTYTGHSPERFIVWAKEV